MSQPALPTGARVIDSHCHLADEAFKADVSEVIARARAAGGVARAATDHTERTDQGRMQRTFSLAL